MLAIPQNRKDLLAITKLCETGEIKPMIDKHYSFDEIPEAFQYVWEGRAKRKFIDLASYGRRGHR